MINNKHIKIVDLIMGGGKTTYCHKVMLENRDKKYIYVTPYLEEIKRVIGDKDNRTILYNERNFREPLHLGDGKLESLHELLNRESNIVTTHALFKMSTSETRELIASEEYILMLDEALDVVDKFDISCDDYELLLKDKKIEVDKKGFVKWLDEDYDGEFNDFKIRFRNGIIAQVKKTKKVYFLVWNFRPEFFDSFKEIYIFTYLFEASYMKYYFDLYDIEYKKYTIEDNELIPFENKKPYNKTNIKLLVNIYEGNLNLIGDRDTALSMNWLKNYPSLKKKLKNNVSNYFKHILNAKAETIIWTTFKSSKSALSGAGYTRRFIPCNTRATNEYKDCYNLAYCCNRYISPDYVDYFYQHGMDINEDLFALSEILQWMWRSSIRIGKPIYIYIPSSRMRNLLIDWLNNENI